MRVAEGADAGPAPGAAGAGAARWDPSGAGVVRLPSGRLVRGRRLGRRWTGSAGGGSELEPTFGVYLLGHPPPPVAWESRWLRWPDFRVPRDLIEARRVLFEAWERTATERVEVACTGGRGRTGTALACLAILDGVPADEAVAFVRRVFYLRAVETPGQRRYVEGFGD